VDINVYQQKVSNIFAENRLLKFGFLVLLIMSVSNWQAIQSASDQQRVVIVPTNPSGELWVKGSDASNQYLRQMARYVTSMIGHYTASTARSQFEELLMLFTPLTYADAKTGFETLSDQIEGYPTVSSRIIWVGNEPLKIDRDRSLMTVDVTRERLVNGDVTRREDKMLLIDYTIVDGQFQIETIQEK